MTVPIMTAFWTSFGVLIGLTIVTFIIGGIMSEEDAPRRTVRRVLRLAFVLFGLVVVAAAFGIWVPVFVPGLY